MEAAEGRPAEAERHLRAALKRESEREPRSVEARCRLAALLAEQPARLAEAADLARGAVALQRTDLTLDTLGLVLLRQGNAAEARDVLQEALDRNGAAPCGSGSSLTSRRRTPTGWCAMPAVRRVEPPA